MTQILLKCFADDCSNPNWNIQFRSWNNGNNTYKNITLVEDDSYTHAVVYNLFRYPLKPIPKKNVVGLLSEPSNTFNLASYYDYARENIGTYFCHDNSQLDPVLFKNGVSFLGPYCGIDQMSPPHIKSMTMSIVASAKNYFPGHQLRHKIIQKILNSNLSIDIFGRGLEGIYGKYDSRLKGTLEDKKIAFDDYKFTIVIENVSEKFWITEKYWDSIMSGAAIPIYWGAEAVNDLYSKNCHVSLPTNGTVDEIFDIIKNTYYNHHQYGFHNIEEAQRIIKEKMNLPEFLWRHFNS